MPPKAAKQSTTSNDAPTSYKISDIVLGKIKGYPAWPGRVADEATAPKKVLKEKPAKGKNATLVQFFPTGDFAWLGQRDISRLTEKEIDAYISGGKKKGDLLKGYETAQDPKEWITDKEDAAALEKQREAEMAAMDEDDQLASENDAPATKGGKGKKDATKKRKRESAAATNGKKDEKKKPKKDTTKTKAGTKKDYTDDENEPASKKSKAAAPDSDAETVKGWRHKLQKIFLGKSNPPADEMPKCAQYFDDMEKFKMEKEWLTESKLAKVLKRIALLKDGVIPDDEKYKFRQRSSDLAAKWASIMQENGDSSPKAEAASTDAAPATTENGTEAAPAESEAAAPAEEESKEEKEEDESAPMEVETNGGDKPEESKTEEEEPKKDAEESTSA